MKKISYQAPETKVIELNLRSALLQTSGEEGGGGGTGHAPLLDPEDVE